MTCMFDAPSARLRSTYRRCFIVRTCARTSRAVTGHDVTPMTKMMLRTDGPRIAASTIASGRKGMTRNHSVKRGGVAASIQPPKKPAATPTTVPMTIAIIVAASPTSRLTRAPYTNCAQTGSPEAVRSERGELRRSRPARVVLHVGGDRRAGPTDPRSRTRRSRRRRRRRGRRGPRCPRVSRRYCDQLRRNARRRLVQAMVLIVRFPVVERRGAGPGVPRALKKKGHTGETIVSPVTASWRRAVLIGAAPAGRGSGYAQIRDQVEDDHGRAEEQKEPLEAAGDPARGGPRTSAARALATSRSVSTAIAPERTKPKLIE